MKNSLLVEPIPILRTLGPLANAQTDLSLLCVSSLSLSLFTTAQGYVLDRDELG